MSIPNIQKALGIVNEPAYDKDLVALHNISVADLKKAIQLGGFPMPSIAITKKQTPYTDCGDITLIMKKDTVNPKKTDVYSRDAYTTTFPETFRTPKTKDITSFIEETITPIRKELGETVLNFGNFYNTGAFHAVREADVEWEAEHMLNATGGKYLFLASINEAPELKEVPHTLEGTDIYPKAIEKMKDMAKKYTLNRKYTVTGDARKAKNKDAFKKDYAEFEQILLEEIEAAFGKADTKKPVSRFGKGAKETLARVKINRAKSGKEYKAIKNNVLDVMEGKTFKDTYTFEKDIEKKIKEHKKAYDAWKSAFMDAYFGETRITETNAEATFENIVRAMKGDTKNKQKSWIGNTPKNVIAAGAKLLHSVKDIHGEAERTLKPTDPEIEETIKKVYDAIVDTADKLLEYKKNKNIGYEEALGVLMDTSQDALLLEEALKAHGFDVDKAIAGGVRKAVTDTIAMIQNVPVKYFEAKPQRAVLLNEVEAAVIPEGTPRDIQDALKENGIKVETYDPTRKGNRERVTNRAQDEAGQYFQTGSEGKNRNGLNRMERLHISRDYTYSRDELATVATITGKEFGEYTDLKDLRGKAIEWYNEHLLGKTIHNDLLGAIRFIEKKPEDIRFTVTGRKKMQSTSANAEKLNAVKVLPDIIEGANIVSTSGAKANKHGGWKFYYLHAKIMTVEGMRYVVVTVADKDAGTVDYYNHNVYTEEEYKKIENDVQETLVDRRTKTGRFSQGTSLSTNSIPEENALFKRKKLNEYYQKQNKGKDRNGLSRTDRLNISRDSTYSKDELKTVATLTGDEYGRHTGLRDQRQEALIWYGNHLQGKTTYNDVIGDVVFDVNIMLEDKDGTGPMENALPIRHLPKLIKGATVITTSKKEQYKGWTFYNLHAR